MNTDKFLHEALSYRLRGLFFKIANTYGKGLKEIIYQKALAEELEKETIPYVREKRIEIHSETTGNTLGVYIPDFVVDDKIIVELKATNIPLKRDIEQQLSYLKASRYELGYVVNFSTPRLYIKRTIYTNDRKTLIYK